MGKRKASYKSKTCCFHGKRHNKLEEVKPCEQEIPNLKESASGRKLKRNQTECETTCNDVNIIFVINIMFSE